jgi:TrmH family RNA methyltransferase
LIESTQNKQFKLWMKLKLKKYRDQHDMFLVYGKHLIDKAKEHDALIDVITSDPHKEGILISLSLMKELQQTPSMIDEIGICKKTNIKKTSNRVLCLDDVQDPDNVGALLRSATAFGFTHVILSDHSADLYNEKTIRASKGAIFDCYVERKSLVQAIESLKSQGYQVIAADAHETEEIGQNDEKVVLILGNEGHGISDKVKLLVDRYVTIETQHVESLNVSVAGAIIMYVWRKHI